MVNTMLVNKEFKIVRRVGKVHIRKYEDVGYVLVWVFKYTYKGRERTTRKLPVGSDFEAAIFIAEKIDNVLQVKELLFLDSLLANKNFPDKDEVDTPEKVYKALGSLTKSLNFDKTYLNGQLQWIQDALDGVFTNTLTKK